MRLRYDTKGLEQQYRLFTGGHPSNYCHASTVLNLSLSLSLCLSLYYIFPSLSFTFWEI